LMGCGGSSTSNSPQQGDSGKKLQSPVIMQGGEPGSNDAPKQSGDVLAVLRASPGPARKPAAGTLLRTKSADKQPSKALPLDAVEEEETESQSPVKSAMPLEAAGVGVMVMTSQGVEGKVAERTMTDVLVRPAGGGEHWVAVDDIVAAKVTIVSARGLRNAYCLCEVEGRPGERVRTRTSANSAAAAWNHEGALLTYRQGDDLVFSVWDSRASHTLLGKAVLENDKLLTGSFHGELPLLSAGDDEECCNKAAWVVVRVEVSGFKEPAPPQEEGLNKSGGLGIVEVQSVPFLGLGCCW